LFTVDCFPLLFLFLKGTMGALVPFSYLVKYKGRSLAEDNSNLFLILFLKCNENNNSANNKDN
jgi:hypothetical protein